MILCFWDPEMPNDVRLNMQLALTLYLWIQIECQFFFFFLLCYTTHRAHNMVIVVHLWLGIM